MSPSVSRPAAAPTGLLEKLLGAVRPEFRVDVYVPSPGDPVLGRPTCPVPGCDRSGWEYGLCPAHGGRWRAQGRPDLTVFLAQSGPELNGRRGLSQCTVEGCQFGTSGFGLCMRHRSAWTTSKAPDSALWASTVPAVSPAGRTECGLPFCDVWAENDKHLFCKSHHTRWHQLGRPDPKQYEAHCLLRGKARIDFRILAPQLKLEFQYAVQCRHDQQTITAPPPVVTWVLRLAANSGVVSLLDHEAQHWRERCTHKSYGWYEGFLLHAHEVVEMLRDGTGWEVEYPRDVWRLHTLPGLICNTGHTPEARNQLRFDRMLQPWLRALAKRWCRLRLSSGLTVGTVISDVTALTRFSMFLENHAPDVTTLADVDRVVGALPGLGQHPNLRRRREGRLHHHAQRVLPSDPSARLGRHAAHDHRVLHRRHPTPTTAAVAPARRVRDGAGRSPRQPRPLATPPRSAADPDSDPLRAAGL